MVAYGAVKAQQDLQKSFRDIPPHVESSTSSSAAADISQLMDWRIIKGRVRASSPPHYVDRTIAFANWELTLLGIDLQGSHASTPAVVSFPLG